jgi:hypothetical protein
MTWNNICKELSAWHITRFSKGDGYLHVWYFFIKWKSFRSKWLVTSSQLSIFNLDIYWTIINCTQTVLGSFVNAFSKKKKKNKRQKYPSKLSDNLFL